MRWIAVCMLALPGMLSGCCVQVTRPVDLALFSRAEVNVEGEMSPRGSKYPTGSSPGVPTSLAVAHVQEGGKGGEFLLVAAEDQAEIARMLDDAGMGIATTDSVELSRRCGAAGPWTAPTLLRCAADSKARWLFVYTIAMNGHTDYWFGALALLTLGLAPNAVSKADVTGYGAIIDVETGAMIDQWSVSDGGWQPANLWTSHSAVRQVSERTEDRVVRKLFEGLGAAVARVDPSRGSAVRRESWGD